jgi:heme/copper-type cytochrome/quinol oxidase subunit 4
MAVAVSEASARVGVGLSIMLSIICVAITCADIRQRSVTIYVIQPNGYDGNTMQR